MFAIPNSSAMDAAAHGGGPTSRVLPWIAGTEPEQVLRYVTQLADQLTKIIGIANQIGDARGALRTAWPSGSASDGAITKFTQALTAFQKITQAVAAWQTEIQAVATALRLVQNGYRSVVSSVNPTVAALLSNQYTRHAATALSTSTTSGLASYVSATKAVLDTIGLVRMVAIATQLATIANELETLLSNGSAVAAGRTPATKVTPTGGDGFGTGGWDARALTS
jgi:hypothetical protein